jgi:hypothetical protein
MVSVGRAFSYTQTDRGEDSALSTQASGKSILWLVHSDKAQSPVREAQLSATGYRVELRNWSSPEIARAKAELPAAVIIDLSRTPSRGRDAAIAMRSHRELLSVPFLITGGTSETIAGVRKFLPDATPSEWPRIAADLRKAIAHPPVGARQLSVFAAYEGVPLSKKLGIKERSVVALKDAPRGLRNMLGELPAGAKLVRDESQKRDLTMWFVDSENSLPKEIVRMKPCAAKGGLWILWNKNQTSHGNGRLTQAMVRKAGLDIGLVDFKITRIDEEWTGLRFTIRK